MTMKIKFLGADRQVTGSCLYAEADGLRLIVDCGLFQEREFLGRNWAPFAFDPGKLDYVLLTHAHLDHCGLLPKLVREGFRGKILTTAVTRELLPIVLEDSAHLQEEDAAFKKKRHAREGRRGPFPEVPLYTLEDARRVLPMVEDVPYRQPVRLKAGVEAALYDAGHILGSAMVELRSGEPGRERRLVITGDVGQWDMPIVKNPSVFDEVDDLVLESTYGDTEHRDPQDLEDMLHDLIVRTLREGGNILIPVFALERAQEVLYRLSLLSAEQRLPRLTTYLDSPMALEVTRVFERHPEFMDRQTRSLLKSGIHPFRFPGLKLVESVEESKAINALRESCVIMAGSGMCTGGRIKHHLARNIGRPECLILFVGYQARGTLGRQILDGQPVVRIHGQSYPVRARVARIHGLSAHADRRDLVRWLRYLRAEPKRIFLVHGEEEASAGLEALIRQEFGWRVRRPAYLEEAELDGRAGDTRPGGA